MIRLPAIVLFVGSWSAPVVIKSRYLASPCLVGSAGAQAQTAGGIGAAATAVPALRVQPLTARVYFVEGELGPVSRANRGFNSNAGFVVTGDGVVAVSYTHLRAPETGLDLVFRLLLEKKTNTQSTIVSNLSAHYQFDYNPDDHVNSNGTAVRAAIQSLHTHAATETPL